MTDDEGIVYRGAYGEASRLIEVADMSLARGRDVASHVPVEREALIAHVRRTRPRAAIELIELAVDDALAKRSPRW